MLSMFTPPPHSSSPSHPLHCSITLLPTLRNLLSDQFLPSPWSLVCVPSQFCDCIVSGICSTPDGLTSLMQNKKKKTTKPHFSSLYPMLTGPQLVIVLLGPSSLPNAGIVPVGGSNNINKQRKPLEKIKPQAMNWSDTLKHAIQYI